MKKQTLIAILAIASLAVDARTSSAAALSYAGTDYDIGGILYPGGTAPFNVVPWRTNTTPKLFDADGNNVYGSAGYAMFGTQASYPNGANCCGSSQPFASGTWPNQISMPSFVSGTTNLVTNKVGGWVYALMDDPTQVNGARDYNWGSAQSPPTANQSAYLKIGILDGNDIYGNNPKTAVLGAGRWGFSVGAGVPASFRIGVMTDGLDAIDFAATEVLVLQVNGTTVLGSIGSGTVTRDRFIDIHTFDIVGAQPGDQFAVFARAQGGNGAISGVTFDVPVPEPASLALGVVASAAGLGLRRRRES